MKFLQSSLFSAAAGALTDAETQLGKVLEIEPENAAARDQLKQVQGERSARERRKQRDALVERARTLSTNQQYDDCVELLSSAQEQFPGDPEILRLLDAATRDQQRLKEKQDLLKQRIREVERMIERQQLTEAIDLSRQTISTIGPDPRLTDTMVKAQKKLTENGILYKTPNGYIQQSPFFSMVNQCVDTITKLSREFGLTPAARSRTPQAQPSSCSRACIVCPVRSSPKMETASSAKPLAPRPQLPVQLS